MAAFDAQLHPKKISNGWSRAAGLTGLILLGGCADGAKLLQESENGGVVVYPFKGEQGALLSTFRTDAFAIMKEKCHGPYTIIREGETRGRTRVAGAVEGAQEFVRERRWAIQFQCK